VYNYAHIGNFRTFIFEDLLRRYLEYRGYRVTQVMNLTDVDDKTIRGSREQGQALEEFTRFYKRAFFEDLKILNIQPAHHYPEATAYIPQMQRMVKILLEKGHAYRAEDGSVYFDISSFPDYGKLARLDPANMRRGERVAADEYEKEDIQDFALWKAWKPEDGEVAWDSPWGKGRPGWHIECSVMSTELLGPHFDIHCGGVDNIFPHHENEIAQSQCATGEPFVNFWLHAEYLLVDGRKMSKSLNNFYLLRDLLEKGLEPAVIRWMLLTTHYRQKLNFRLEAADEARRTLERLWIFADTLKEYDPPSQAEDDGEYVAELEGHFQEVMDDDLNISAGVGALFDFVRETNRRLNQGTLSAEGKRRAKEYLQRLEHVFGVFDLRPVREEELDVAAIEALLAEREAARKRKDFAAADALRDRLREQGIEVLDTPQGPKWRKR